MFNNYLSKCVIYLHCFHKLDLMNFLGSCGWTGSILEIQISGSLGGAAVWRLPLAQGAILETPDRIPRRAPCMEPASPSACVSASLSLCDYHE